MPIIAGRTVGSPLLRGEKPGPDGREIIGAQTRRAQVGVGVQLLQCGEHGRADGGVLPQQECPDDRSLVGHAQRREKRPQAVGAQLVVGGDLLVRDAGQGE